MSLLSASVATARATAASSWRYEAWLNAYPLNKLTVLDYFKNSPFYVMTCNNEQVVITAPNTAGTAIASIAERLKRLAGLEFEVEASDDPNYFLIRRQWRVNPNQVHVEALYYIIGVDAGSPPANVTMNDPQDIQAQSSAFATVLQRGTVIPLPCLGQVIDTAMYTTLMKMNRAVTRFGHLMQLRDQVVSEAKHVRSSETDASSKHTHLLVRDDADNKTREAEIIDSLISHSRDVSNKERHGHSHLVDQALNALLPAPHGLSSRAAPRSKPR